MESKKPKSLNTKSFSSKVILCQNLLKSCNFGSSINIHIYQWKKCENFMSLEQKKQHEIRKKTVQTFI